MLCADAGAAAQARRTQSSTPYDLEQSPERRMEQGKPSQMAPLSAEPQRSGTPAAAAATPQWPSEDDWTSAARPASPPKQPPATTVQDDVQLTAVCSQYGAGLAKLPRATNIFRKKVAGAESLRSVLRQCIGDSLPLEASLGDDRENLCFLLQNL